MSTLEFWENAAKGIYDRCVLGKYAPALLRSFLKEEDRRLTEVLEAYVKKRKDVVFLEIGSGTGRYLRYFGRKILEKNDFNQHLKYVIGVDFSESMIRTSIDNLVRSRNVGNTNVVSLADELASKLKLPVKAVKEKLTSRVILINADATKPFLQIPEGNVVVGIMFGTLGNISRDKRDFVLQNIHHNIVNGEVVITLFNRKKMEVGWKIYRELAKAGFDLLTPLITHKAEFTTCRGFYSQWFTMNEFEQLLKKNFKDYDFKITPFKHGLFGKVRLKESSPHSKFTLNLLCPKCGNTLTKLPLSL